MNKDAVEVPPIKPNACKCTSK